MMHKDQCQTLMMKALHDRALTALATVTIWRSKLKMDFSTEELLQKLELYMVYAAFCQNWINQVSNVKLLANITS